MTKRWNLSQLFENAGLPQGLVRESDRAITAVTDNSRTVEAGSLFVATRGTTTDSHLFISDAIERGAAAVVVEQDIPAYKTAAVVRVPDSRDALGRLAHAFVGNPSRDMTVFGVTGTNGKTTTTYLLESILRAAGRNPGVIGTIEHRFGGKSVTAANTTPSAPQLAALFAEMRDAGADCVAMEVSSHALDQRRVSGIAFDGGILTNITQDHLDYHGTMEAYAGAKQLLFGDHLHRPGAGANAGGAVAAFNVDDDWGRRFAAAFDGRHFDFGMGEGAAFRATGVSFDSRGMQFRIDSPEGPLEIRTHLVGLFNVMNILGAAAACLGAGIPRGAVLEGISALRAVSGRFEKVDAGQPFLVLVDYSHTPDALERAISNARTLTRGRLITVFGCGGDRDNTKRPIMGRVAAQLSDLAIVTSDNPRTEDPERIASMVIDGVLSAGLSADRHEVILDRRAAIGRAIDLAARGDLVLIAGKGHEDYQILGTTKIHFDDREVAREFLGRKVRG